MSRSYIVTILLPHFTWVTLTGCSATEGKCETLLKDPETEIYPDLC